MEVKLDVFNAFLFARGNDAEKTVKMIHENLSIREEYGLEVNVDPIERREKKITNFSKNCGCQLLGVLERRQCNTPFSFQISELCIQHSITCIHW